MAGASRNAGQIILRIQSHLLVYLPPAPQVKKPIHERDGGPTIQEIIADLPRHVWDSSAEVPETPIDTYIRKELLARKAVKVKRKKKVDA